MTRFTRVLVEPEPAPALTPEELIARDESLAEEIRSAARIWTNHRAIVAPRWRLQDVAARSVEDNHRRLWPLCARGSGGGVVAHGPGTMNLSLILPLHSRTDPSIDDAYALWIDVLARALRPPYGIEVVASEVDVAFCNGRYDAAVGGRKLAGTAQMRRRGVLTVHGTILVDVDADEYLTIIERADVAMGLPECTYDRARIATVSDLVGRRVEPLELAGHIAAVL